MKAIIRSRSSVPTLARIALLIAAITVLALLQTITAGRSQAVIFENGFESGDLSGWEVLAETEGVSVMQSDPFTDGTEVFPLEGNYMARIANSQPSNDEAQPIGVNELSQLFEITQAVTSFAYNIWTYDYTGFDTFSIELITTEAPVGSASPAGVPGVVLFSYDQQAWGSANDTTLKSSGWRIIKMPTAGWEGSYARLTISAGGTFDSLYAFWAYVDSADDIDVNPCTDQPVGGAEVCDAVDITGVQFNGHSPSFNAATGLVHITPTASDTSFGFSAPVLCPDGSMPTAVTAVLGTSPVTTVPLTKGAGNVWSGTIPLPPGGVGGTTWQLSLSIACPSGTIVIPIGPVTLIDPSGFITDSETDEPIVGATVTLQRLDGEGWADVNPFETQDGGPVIDPQVNPQLSDGEGHYGWLVAPGDYRVVVDAEGYNSQTSPEVTIPPPVFDLNLALVPVGAEPVNVLGDADCDDNVNAVDALKILRHTAGLSVSQNEPCPNVGTEANSLFGDVDCDDDVDSVDALKVLRFIAALSVQQEPGCRAIGT